MKAFTTIISILLISISLSLSAQNSPIFTIETVTTTASTATVKIKAVNFTNIKSGDLVILYNPAVVIPTGVTKGNGLPFPPSGILPGTLTTNLSNSGELIFGWFNGVGVSVPDGMSLFNITFDKVSLGTSALNFDLSVNNYCQFYNGSGVKLNDSPSSTYYIPGSLTFNEHLSPVTTAPNLTACVTDIVSIPITVTGLNNIGAVSLLLTYDPSVLSFNSADNTGGFPDLIINNPIAGTIAVNGIITDNPEGFSLADNSVFYTLNFTYHGGSSSLSWIDNGESCEYAGPIPDLSPLSDVPQSTYYINGSVGPCAVIPTPTIVVGSIVNPTTCGGTGTIPLTFTNVPAGTYTIEYDGPGSFTNVVVTGNSTSSTATIIAPAGTYNNLQITVNSVTSAAGVSATVTDPALPTQPTITAGGSTTFCEGGSVTLTSSAGSSYLWSTGATTQSITVNAAGSYWVKVKNAAGCESVQSLSTVVTVNALPTQPTITAGGLTTFCEGGSVTLTSSAGSSYLWSTGATTQSITVNAAGSYWVKVKNAAGCESVQSLSTVVTVNALPTQPTITAGGLTTFCEGGSVTLTSSAGSSYLWSTGATTQSITVNAAGSYWVKVKNAAGCESVQSLSTVVTVNALPTQPTITAGGSTTFCEGSSVTLTSSAGTSYLWSTGATTQSITVNAAGSYWVKVKNAAGCESVQSLSTVVTVNALPTQPTITAGGSTTFCEGSSVTLTSSTGSSYLWSTGATTQSITVNAAGSYWVKVKNAAGCESVQSLSTVVTVNALPTQPTITAGGLTTFCEGGSVTLTSSAGSSYLWSTGATTQSITVNAAGSYWVKVKNAAGCESVQSLSTVVTVNALPTQPTITAGGSTTFCEGSSVTLTSSAGSSYLWSTGATTQSITVNAAGSYWVKVKNAAGCESVQSLSTVVTVNALPTQPTITAGGLTTFCEGGSVTLTSSAGTSYLWSTGATTQSITVNAAGSYWVKVKNAAGCESVQSLSTVVTVNALPTQPTITAGGSTTFCEGSSVTLTSSAGSSYLWSTGATTQSITVNAAGSYWVKVKNAAGCESVQSLSTVVTVNALPTQPTITAGGSTTFCEGSSVTLTSSTGSSYLWSTGATTQSITVNAAGSYWVKVKNAAGCESVQSLSTVVTVNALPTQPTITAGGLTTFCEGGSVTLTSSAGSSYLWSTGATTQSITVNAAGSYWVKVKNAAGCESVQSLSTVVTVNALPTQPTITAGGLTTFCEGGSVTLTSSAGSSYLWSTGATTQSITVNAAGSYWVKVKNAAGCESVQSLSTVVTVNALPTQPTITAGGLTTFCEGGSVTLTSSAGSSYLWSTGATTQSITVNAAGSYWVKVKNAAGCESVQSLSTVVTVNALPTQPTITAGGSTTFCEGGSVTLTSSAGSSYLWSTGATTQSITVNAAGSYWVKVKNAAGCESVQSLSTVVTVNALPTQPTITAGGLTTFCEGGSVTLTSSAGSSYLWSTGATTQSITVNAAGSYWVKVKNAAGCESVQSLSTVVTVNALPTQPTITAGGSTTFCEGSSVTLTSSAGTSYLWSTGATTQSITVNAAGSYWVKVKNAAGCESVQSLSTVVTVNALPTQPTITAGGSTTFCEGSSVTLTSSTGSSYLWSTGATTQSITVNAAGSYWVKVKNAAGCESVQSLSTVVTVNALPTQPTITAGGLTTFCEGGSVTLTSSAGSSYLWSTGATTQSITVNAAGSYWVKVKNAAGCESVQSLSTVVTVNALPTQPTITAGGLTTFCEGGSVTLTSSAGSSYLWSTGATTQSITVNAAGSYWVKVKNAAGCESVQSLSTVVTVNALPTQPTITAGGSTTFCEGSSVTLTSSAGTSYLWSTGATTQSITVNAAGSYWVKVKNAAGCESVQSLSTVVTVNALPTQPTITAGGSTTFCEGSSVTLTSSTGSSYLWSTGATTQSITVNAAGSYWVKVKNAAGCESVQSLSTVVTVNALPTQPTITAGGLTTFCEGGSVTLTSSAGSSYLWSTGATTQSITVNAAGSYWVKVKNAAGCESVASASTVVTVNALPVVDAGIDVTIANGTSTTLDATVTGEGPFTYSWTPSAQLVNALVEDPTTVNLSSTTVFTLTATSTITTCSNSDAVTVTITGGALSSTPTATPEIICAGENVQLDAVASGGSGSYSYAWTSVPAGFTSSLSNPTVNPTVNTIYHVSVSDGFSTVSSQVVVTVNALPTQPTITAGGLTTFCEGGSVTLTSSAGSSYLWSTGATTQSITVNAAGSYWVKVKNAAGCESVQSLSTVVTVNALPTQPTITAGGLTTFCEGGSVTLTSSAGTSYLWSTGATTQSITVNAAGSYWVKVKNAAGCESVQSLSTVVTVNALPTQPTITAGGSTTFCEGSSVTLTSSTGSSYLWSTGATTQSITVNAAGSYWVKVNNAAGCESVQSLSTVVTVNALPTQPTITAGGSTTFCEGSSVTLTSSAGSSYLWSTGATTQSITVNAAGSYWVKVKNAAGCESVQSLSTVVTVNALPTQPTITDGGLTTFCEGGSVTLTSSAGSSYLWSTGATTQSITVNAAGSYWVKVKNAAGCESVQSLSTVVTVNALPTQPTITAGGSTTFCEGGSVTLTSSAGSSYLWSTGATTQSITVNAAGSYWVKVKNAAGCESVQSLSTVVTVNALPTQPTITAGGSTTFCEGGSVTLTSSAGSSYLWSTGATTQSITVNAAGSYWVKVKNAAGCESVQSLSTVVTVNALPTQPTITAGGLTTFCEGGSVTLTSSAGSSYLWSTGATTQSITVNAAGSYWVKVKNAAGCESVQSLSTVVTVNALPTQPTITAGGSTTFCEGSSVTLTSSAGSSYLWSTGATTQSITVNAAGSYWVKVKNAAGCESVASASTVVTVNALPVVDAGIDVTIANGTSTTLDATVTGEGPFTYSWTPSAQLVNALVEDPTTVNLSSTTVFTLTATSTITTCSNSDAVTVTITGGALSSTPTATPEIICAGENVQLDAVASGGSGSYSYTWTSVPAGFTSSLSNPTVNPTVNTIYHVSVSDGFSTVSSQVVVTVNALPTQPTITAGGLTTFCEGGSVTLTSSAGSSYLWSTGATTQSITVNAAGSYWVKVKNAAGCESVQSLSTVVTVNALPTQPTITAGGLTTFCEGGSVTLTSSAGTSYLWSTGATTQSITVNAAGSYWVKVKNAAGCESVASASTVVTVNALPVVDAGIDVTIANGTSTTLDATVTGEGPFTYSWTPSAQLVNALVEDPTTVNLSSTTVFTLTATSTITTCSNSDAVTVTITGGALSSTPTATPEIICAGENVQLDAVASGGSGSYSYTWTSVPAGFTSSLSNPTVNPTVNTIYHVSVSDGFSTVSSQVVVTVNALPTQPTITAGGLTTFCEGGSVTLTSSAGSSYLWSTGATTQSITVNAAGSYWVKVKNAAGCESVASASTEVIITPSSDNITTIEACDSYTWNGTEYTTTGIYRGTTTDCVTEVLDLTITPSSDNITIIEACDSYIWNGTEYTATGLYRGTTTDCVTEVLDLTITPSSDNITIIEACDSYTWNGTEYTTTGIYRGTTTECVTEVLDLTITPSSDNITTIEACDSYTWNGTEYTTTGIYRGTTTDCVTEVLDLTITPSSDNITTIEACDSYTWNGTEYTATGIYRGTTTDCVTEVLDLTITPSSDNITTIEACDSYTWNGTEYTTTGIYRGTTTDCVTEVLDLTITPSSDNITTIEACDSYTWNGTEYTATGIYRGTTTDCVTEVLDLTITPSSDNITTIEACDSYTWNGTEYTATGIYRGTTTDCVTEVLDLTITPSSDNITTIEACDSYTWNGTEYTTTGIYRGTTTDCVTEVLDLTITPSSDNITTIEACDSYTWNGTEYTTTGIYRGTTTDCVTEVLDLTITPIPPFPTGLKCWETATWTSAVCDWVITGTQPITPTITPNGPTEFYQGGSVTLTSSTGYSYLWSTGETTQSIIVSTSGSFWVKTIDEKGCESEQSTPVTVNVLPVNQDCGGSVLGNTEVYSSVSYSPRRYAIPVTFAESGTINCITIYHNGGTGKVLTGVYADNTGTPTTLLGKTIAANVNSSEGWQTISLINPVEVQRGKTVWLTWVFENNPGVRETTGTPNKAYSFDTWSNGMPDAFGHAYFANFKYSVYCNYTPKIEATNIGNTDIYGNTIKWGAQLAMPVTFSEAGEITSISIYHDGGTGSMLLGVYSDQGGFPSSRLAKTAITTVNPVAGWQTIQLPTPLQVVSGQKVWLSWVFQTVPAIHYTTGTPGRAASSNTWANQMPASFGTSTIAPTKYSIYCTFSTQGSQPDGIAPVVTAFNIPAASASLTVPVSSFTATDNKAVTGYKLTESATAPLAGDAGWSATAPVSYDFATSGTKTLYAWAKDAAGNVSAGISAQVIIMLPDYNIGNTDIYGSTIKWGAQLAMPVTFSEAGEITSISIYHDGGTGSMLLGVYSDQGGFPSSRLAKTAITTVNPVAGWQTIQLPTPLQVVSGQKVWLSWVFQTVPAIHYTTGTPGRAASSNTWANQMPASFGTSTIAPTKYSIYCTFSTQGSLPDGIAPVVTAFNIPSASTSLTVPVSSFTATDNKAVTGYKLTESATAPLAGDAGWSATAPVSYDFATSGTKTLYAWAKDAAGNVSAGISAQVIITLPDYNIGNTDIYGSTIKWGAQLAMPVTFNEAGEITSISIYHDGGTGSMLLGVYSDQGGFPSSRLAKTAITTVNPVAGWQTIQLPTPLQVVSGQKVWLSWVFQIVPAIHYTTGTPGRAASSNTWANQMPASFGTSTIAPTKYSIYCTYTTTKSAEIATSVIPDVDLSDLRVYPNPFSDRLHFEFVSPESVNARIDLYDLTGRMIKTIFEQPVESGVRYEAEFRPETIISGMYIYRITMGEKVTNGKVIFKKE